MVMHVIGYHMQLWSHIHRQCFHNSVDTNNFTESFNNVLKNHYLTLRNDKSVFSLTKILLQCVFPDQEREYTISTARQTTAYRQPRNALPQFLTNRPSSVTSACLVNIEKGKFLPSKKMLWMVCIVWQREESTKYKSRKEVIHALTSHREELESPASISSASSRISSGSGKTYLSSSQKAHSWHLTMTYYMMNTLISVLLKRTSQLHSRQLQYQSIRHLAPNCFACKSSWKMNLPSAVQLFSWLMI